MKSVRIIPKLDIKGPNLVKGIHLEGLRVMGKPERFARHYYECGADELFYRDAVASLYNRNSLLDIVRRTSKEIFVPLTVGGGLRSLKDIEDALKTGADKVAVNTAAIRNPKLVKEAAEKFGSSTIMVSIEAIRKEDGSYEAYTDNGREETGIEVFGWAKQVEELGAGEIMLTSINNEGSGEGFDLHLIRKVATSVGIPVIACGGAGRVEDIYDVITEGKADAVSIASILHYNFAKKCDLVEGDFAGEGVIEFLRHKRLHGFSKIKDCTLTEVKQYLFGKGIECRHGEAGQNGC